MELVKRNLNVLCLLLAFVCNYSVAAPSGCMLVSNTGTVIPPPVSTLPLGNFVKINLNKLFFDTEGNACDTTYSQITVPVWATWVKVTGHVSFPEQTIGAGHLSIHLFRNVHGATSESTGLTSYGLPYYSTFVIHNTAGDGPTPEAHYHNRAYFPQQPAVNKYSYYSILATTGWIPVLAVQETWTLYAWQDATLDGITNPSITTPGGVEQWLSAEFQ